MIDSFKDLIEMVPGKRSGKPCLKGTRITVGDVLGWLAAGMSIDDILAEYDWLTRDSIVAAIQYAQAQQESTHAVSLA